MKSKSKYESSFEKYIPLPNVGEDPTVPTLKVQDSVMSCSLAVTTTREDLSDFNKKKDSSEKS